MVSARKCRVTASILRGTTRAYISRVSIDGESLSSRMAIRTRFHAPEIRLLWPGPESTPRWWPEAHFPGWNIRPMTDTVWLIIIICGHRREHDGTRGRGNGNNIFCLLAPRPSTTVVAGWQQWLLLLDPPKPKGVNVVKFKTSHKKIQNLTSQIICVWLNPSNRQVAWKSLRFHNQCWPAEWK